LLLTYTVLLDEKQYFLPSLEWGYFAQSWYSLPMKTLRGRQYSFKMLTQFSLLNNVLDPLACYINGSVQEVQCFFHSLEKDCFAQRYVINTWEAWEFGTLSLKSLVNSHCLTACQTLLLLTLMVLFQEMQCFLHSIQWGYFAQRWWSSPMKTLRVRQYCFHILTPFSQGNKVQDPCASNSDCSYKTYRAGFIHINGAAGTKEILLTFQNRET
jgi:hypothetical protein